MSDICLYSCYVHIFPGNNFLNAIWAERKRTVRCRCRSHHPSLGRYRSVFYMFSCNANADRHQRTPQITLRTPPSPRRCADCAPVLLCVAYVVRLDVRSNVLLPNVKAHTALRRSRPHGDAVRMGEMPNRRHAASDALHMLAARQLEETRRPQRWRRR